MKYKGINVYEICPLIFIDLDKYEKQEGVEDYQAAVNIVDKWLCKMSPKNKVLYNFISECNIDTMVELRPRRDMTTDKYIQALNLAKEAFDNVKLDIYLDDFVLDDGVEVGVITFNDEKEFWDSKFITEK